ncbi:MAG: zinc metallopeptidase [Clostridiales bacterium]|jgi:Zn-dependent membrane protease YugP|nr:zinc metallopeptidase [Clostridiales bacterium]
MFLDKYYIILVLPTVIISLICQAKVSSAFKKYSKVGSSRGLTGAEAAKAILKRNGLFDVTVERVSGMLSDHYDPRKKCIRLSDAVYSGASVASVGVAAHETGHAIQHSEQYAWLGLRSAIMPVAGIGSSLGPYMAIFGLMFRWDILIIAGILLFSGAVVFYIVTLPVEFDASSRALEALESNGMLSPNEIAGSRKVLQAAAMTYVASALTAVASLTRLILLSRNRRRD